MLYKINELKIFYHGIYDDLENIVHICPICTQKNIVFYKRIPTKQIIFNKPKERYVMDLTYLPIELCKKTKIKYLFNLIDHFSKFIISYPIENKNGKTIANKLEQCFKEFGVPNQIGSDNGSEFINKYVNNILTKNNIIAVHGRPYCPHSQGIVERAHRTIRTELVSKYLENKIKFLFNII